MESSELLEGVTAIDEAAVYAAVTTNTALAGKRNHTLKFEGDEGGYLFLDIRPTHVLVTQNTVDDEDVLSEIVNLVDTLTRQLGLNVWDPQQGRWFPGSPALRAAKAVAKTPAAKKPAAKPKPAAKKKSSTAKAKRAPKPTKAKPLANRTSKKR